MDMSDFLNPLGLQRRVRPAGYILPVLGGIGVGFVAGLAVGALFAPKKGSELRHDLSAKASEAAGRVGHAASNLRERVATRVRTTRGQAQPAAAAETASAVIEVSPRTPKKNGVSGSTPS